MEKIEIEEKAIQPELDIRAIRANNKAPKTLSCVWKGREMKKTEIEKEGIKPELDHKVIRSYNTAPKTMLCVFCNAAYSTKKALQKHLLKHIGVQGFLCNECGLTFDRPDRFAKHMNGHRGMEWNGHRGPTQRLTYDCRICNKSFDFKMTLNRHIKKHTEEEGYNPKLVSKEEGFTCELCGANYRQRSGLQTHFKENHGKKNVECVYPQCKKMFTNERRMLMHNITHSKGKDALCTVCYRGFKTVEKLELHMTTHNGTARFKCPVCDMGFTSKQQLQHHYLLHTGEKPVVCMICGDRFRCHQYLRNHMLDHTGEKPFSCNVCHRAFKRKPLLERHILTHELGKTLIVDAKGDSISMTDAVSPVSWDQFIVKFKEMGDNPTLQAIYLQTLKTMRHKPPGLDETISKLVEISNEGEKNCRGCSKTFATFKALEEHLPACYTVKPFSCEHCDKSFIRLFLLEVHMYSAHGLGDTSKWNGCADCDKSFSSKQRLRAHMVTHVRKKPKKYQCEHCPKGYATRQYMIAHLQLHLGGNVLYCKKCPKKFVFKHHLRLHMARKHKEGKRDIVCHICGDAFPETMDLISHQRKHFDNKPYSCTICSKAYKVRSAARLHVIEHFQQYIDNTEGHLAVQQRTEIVNRIKDGEFIKYNPAEELPDVHPSYGNGNRAEELPDVALFNSDKPVAINIKEEPGDEECDDNWMDNVDTVMSDGENDPKIEIPAILKVDCYPSSSAVKSEGETPYIAEVKVELHEDNNALSSQFFLQYEVCPICGVQQGTKAGLELHLMGHRGETPYCCNLCNREFPRKSTLKRHISGHIKSNHKCAQCRQKFSSTSLLLLHNCPQRKDWFCDFCNRSFINKSTLRAHIIRKHTEPHKYKCGICGRGFARPENIRDHLITHSRVKPYQCTICLKSFACKSYHALHVSAHSNPTNYNCEVCGTVFIRKQHLVRHMVKHGDSSDHKCPICGKMIANKAYLQIHINNHAGIRNFKCGLCRRDFISKNNLLRHLTSSHKGHDGYEQAYKDTLQTNTLKGVKKEVGEEKLYICPYCGKEYHSSTKFKYHKYKHTNDYPVQCDICKKGCETKSILRKHMVTHDGMSYPCQHCAKSFRSMRSVKNHERSHQAEASENPFSCKECGEGFTNRKDYGAHLPTHATQFYPCSICGKVFHRKFRLLEHEEKHLNPNKFQCSVCGKSFGDAPYLRKHMRLHSENPPNACTECGHAFVNVSHLKRHMKKHLKNPHLEKQFACDFCDKRFLHKTSLRYHMAKGRHETGAPPPSAFVTVSEGNDEAHQALRSVKNAKKQQVEPIDPSMPFSCKECGEGFTKRKDFCDHLASHASEYYPCTMCDKVFYRKFRLVEHEERHKNPAKFQCDFCDKSFLDGAYYRKHLLLHGDDPPYSCGECGRAFVNGSQLTNHMKRHLKKR